MNIPYVKKFDNFGDLVNPIESGYFSSEPNRKQRREYMNRPRFHGESNNYHLTVFGGAKYKRVVQLELDKNGNKKRIEHYIKS